MKGLKKRKKMILNPSEGELVIFMIIANICLIIAIKLLNNCGTGTSHKLFRKRRKRKMTKDDWIGLAYGIAGFLVVLAVGFFLW